MKYLFSTDNTNLIITLDTEAGKYNPEITTINDPNITLENDRIWFYENGKYIRNFSFDHIGTISGVTPTSIADAFTKLNVVIDGLYLLVSPNFKGSIVPTDTPTGTEDAVWIATQAGTYTNFGGVVVSANSRAEISRVNGVFSISQTAFVIPPAINKIIPWTATSFASGDQVNYLGKDWVANAATVSEDVPGVSVKWEERLAGYVDKRSMEYKALYQIKPFIDLTHKNLFDKKEIQLGKFISTASGLITDGNNAIVSGFIEIDPAEQYIISSDVDLGLSYYKNLAFYADDMTTVVGKSKATSGGAIEESVDCDVEWFGYGWKILDCPSTAKYVVFAVRAADITTTIYQTAKIQMEVGLTRTDYDDRNPLPSKVEVNNNTVITNEISPFIKYTHKNLFDISKIQREKYIITSTGKLTYDVNAIVSGFIEIDPTEQYIISSESDLKLSHYKNLVFYADDMTTVVGKSKATSGGAIEESVDCDVEWFGYGWKILDCPSTAKYVVFAVRAADITTTIYQTAKIQMEVGLTRTDYDDRTSFFKTERGVALEKKQEADYDTLLDLIVTAQTVKSRWNNKRYGSFGDSIAASVGRIGYQTYINSLIGFSTSSNLAISGQKAATIDGNADFNSIVDDYVWANYDIITIGLGTNDFAHDVPLGTIVSTAATEFYGAWNIILDYIFTQNPLIKVILLTPFQRTSKDIANSEGLVLIDYVNAIIKIGEKYSCPVLDCYRESGVNMKTLGIYTDDGLHLINLGYQFVGEWMATQIKDL